MHVPHQLTLRRNQIIQGRHVLARNDEDVGRSLRIDVAERHKLVVFMDDSGGNFTADDPAEQAASIGQIRLLLGVN